MSSATTVTESKCTCVRLTPAEAFWQTDPFGLPPYIHSKNPSTPSTTKPSTLSSEKSESKGWNRKRTPARINANHERLREEGLRGLKEDYVMMCLKPGCMMYGTYGAFDKCVHNMPKSKIGRFVDLNPDPKIFSKTHIMTDDTYVKIYDVTA